MRKGQASTEYLVILAVVIIIALVVVAVLGGFIDIGSGASEQSAKAYWRTADIGILDWSVAATAATAVVRNNQDYRVTITAATIGGAAAAGVPVTLTPGASSTITATVTCTAGDNYAFDVGFTYDNIDYGIADKTFTGSQKIVGTC